MKYIVDMDKLDRCLDLLPTPVIQAGEPLVKLNDVKELVDIFKDEICGGNKNECKNN